MNKKRIKKQKLRDRGKGIEITIFFLVAYGLNFLIGIPLMSKQYLDPNLYGGFMMILPAIAVFLAKLYRDKRLLDQDRVLYTTLFGLGLIYLLMMGLGIFGVLGDKIASGIVGIFTVICSIVMIVNVWFKKNGKGLFLILSWYTKNYSFLHSCSSGKGF